MRTLSRIFVGLVMVGALVAGVYQRGVVREREVEVGSLQRELRAAEAALRRAEARAAERPKAASEGLSSEGPRAVADGSRALPATVDASASAQAGSLALPATTAAVEYRSPPMTPGTVLILPSADSFEAVHFQPDMAVATWTELVGAGVGLRLKAQGVEEYLQTHAVLAGLIDSLRDTSNLLQKDTGTNPDVTQTLQKNYAVTTAKLVSLAKQIAERPNEQPDAVEVSKQLGSLGETILKRIPPETVALASMPP